MYSVSVICISVILTVFLNCGRIRAAGLDKDHEIFKLRSDNDWRTVWHHERHRRCYKDLLTHMEWVCTKDIYKIVKKDIQPPQDDQTGSSIVKSGDSPTTPFLPPEMANNIFFGWIGRVKRDVQKRGIMDECCHGEGCNWEEYAEYCPTNKRIRTRIYNN